MVSLAVRFWEEAAGVLQRLRITDAGRDLCVQDLEAKLAARTLCVHALGESGAGKSSLLCAIVRAGAGAREEESKDSHRFC